jgi:DNA-binding response OmpR family regulator
MNDGHKEMPEAWASRTPGGGMKDILIVEDGKIERERLQVLFSNAGYQVEVCESVSAAEQVLGTDRFRLAILDIGLGDKSGSYLFHLLRTQSAASYVIIFTGNPSVHLKQRFLDEGAVDYIVKASVGAKSENFLARVRDLLGEPSGESSHAGIPFALFLETLDERSRSLFLDAAMEIPACSKCGGSEYQLVFHHQTQMPPEVVGKICCQKCGTLLDPEIE